MLAAAKYNHMLYLFWYKCDNPECGQLTQFPRNSANNRVCWA